jgi:hypothetical protein
MDRDYGSERTPEGYPIRNAQNRYLQKREDMRWSTLGMGTNFTSHDIFATESQGAIHDHDREHLVGSDKTIVRARGQLLKAIRDVEAGKDPVGVIRDPGENVYDDLLVLTEVIDDGADIEQVCAAFEKMKIYELDPRIVEAAQPAA